MKDRQDMEGLWKSTRRPMLIVAFGIILYELLENFTSVRAAVGGFMGVITPVFIGISIAFIANMPMHFLEERLFAKWKPSGLKRGVCVVLAMAFVITIVVLLVVIVGPQLTASIKTFAEDFDKYAYGLNRWANELWDTLNLNADVEAKLKEIGQEFIKDVDAYITGLSAVIVTFTINVAGLVVDLIFAFIISMYCLASKETLMRQGRKLVKAAFSERTADKILHIASATNTSLHNYLYGMITECFILGIMCFVGMSILDYPFALLISVLVGIGQIVPIVGAWVSAGIGAVILFVVEPSRALWFLVMVLAIQQVEGNVIYPRVVGNAVGISGLWVMIALLLGAGLFGLLGALLCVPIMAVLHTMVREWVNRRLEEKRAAGQEI